MGIPRRRRGLGVLDGATGRASACDVPALPRRELTLKKGDIVYIHKEVDKNWLEGEHHGRLGIFPANYVEVSWGQQWPRGRGEVGIRVCRARSHPRLLS